MWSLVRLVCGVRTHWSTLGMTYINPALFHVLGNIRIITAGILYRIMMGKTQTDIQWSALVILTSGPRLSLRIWKRVSLEAATTPFTGCFSLCVCAFAPLLPAFTRKNTSKSRENVSIFYQNCVLYGYGIVINAVYLLITDYNGLVNEGFLDGYDHRALVVLIAQSTMGVTLSFVFKVRPRQYLNNIVYVISLPVSMVLTAIFSILFYEFQVTVTFVAAVGIITVSICIL